MYHYVFGHPGRITRVFATLKSCTFFLHSRFQKKTMATYMAAIQLNISWSSRPNPPGRCWCEGELEELGQGTGSRARRGRDLEALSTQHGFPTWYGPPMNGPGGILSHKYISSTILLEMVEGQSMNLSGFPTDLGSEIKWPNGSFLKEA